MISAWEIPLSPARSRTPILLALLVCAVACVAVSSQSLWIDEAETATKVIQPTLPGCWHALYQEHISNLQMPLYFIYAWGWVRLFGVSEFALRAANIPWFFLGFFAIAHFLRGHPGIRDATLLLYCLHPFVWYYLNEARPYIMQLSGALLVAGCMFAALDESGQSGKSDGPFTASWWWFLGAGLILLCGPTMTGLPWAIGVAILLGVRPNFWKSMRRRGLPALAVSLPLLAALALYYAWTIKVHVGTGYLPMTVASNLAALYEQFGFLGLGPGRTVLRAVSIGALRPYFLPLALLALPLAWGLLLAGRRRFGLAPASFTAVLLLVGLCVCFVIAFGYLRHARILARHLTPLFPFLLLAQACAMLMLWKNGRFPGRAAAALLLAMLVLSSLEVRFAYRHSKDDYRSAAAAANRALAQGKTVWWAADTDGANYYHLPLAADSPGAARLADKLHPDFSTPPDQIYLSKPDLFDPTGATVAFAAAHGYRRAAQWQSFTVWEKPPSP